MPRGPTLKSAKRKAYWIGKKTQEGIEQGKLEAHKKKPLEESAKEHIGHIIDKTSAKDAIDVAIMAGIAYQGYKVYGNWIGALIGEIGYKLATTMGGTPPVSQTAGLAILATIGIPTLIETLADVRDKALTNAKKALDAVWYDNTKNFNVSQAQAYINEYDNQCYLVGIATGEFRAISPSDLNTNLGDGKYYQLYLDSKNALLGGGSVGAHTYTITQTSSTPPYYSVTDETGKLWYQSTTLADCQAWIASH
jgi:hypothetical protein